MKTADKDTTVFLLARYLQSEFDDERLLEISAETLQILTDYLSVSFGELDLAKDDIKDIWTEYLNIPAVHDSLVRSELIILPCGSAPELNQLVYEVCCEAIYKL